MNCLNHHMLEICQSLSKLFNLVIKDLRIPKFMELMSITSPCKNRGVRSDLGNERGIFNVSKVRSILDKMIYSDVYDDIDKNVSFSNVGERRKINLRDHLFIVYAALQ